MFKKLSQACCLAADEGWQQATAKLARRSRLHRCTHDRRSMTSKLMPPDRVGVQRAHSLLVLSWG